ncbi:signal peptide peptidase SppA [Aliidiomarina soli]|uniref:Signal peptide peptidase SppA n=1 Tax=Aliidiomarina soli TaxID=1928574 RepID=A0A432WMP8_9GAMM|nr:signal peptide peptidase SppA [Aliidiomarina soli]RUO35001.1 signal peptide peptidase SppA [Aliidiomarina soli]
MKLLRNLLSKLWRIINATRIVLLNVIFFVLLILFITVLSTGEDIPEVPEDGLLVINPHGILVEEETYVAPFDMFFQEAFNSGPEIPEVNVHHLVATINEAINDERIGGIVLDLRHFSGGGLSKMQMVGERLNAFRESGRPVFAVGDYYTQSQYYLASHADTLYLNPMGAVNIEGFHYYQMYFKNLLEKLKINQHIFQVGQYKSAVEPFMREDMSAEAREANQAWLNELWTQYLNGVQLHRDIAPEIASGRIEDFMRVFERSGNDQAQMALDSGLVDRLASREEMRVDLINMAGLDTDKNTYRHITLEDYQHALRAAQRPQIGETGQPEVAVIVGRGAIMDGSRRAGEIGGDSLAAELREARLNDNVKAVVLRIDSPGGSAFASEIIRQEIVELREAGKPVVASMSSTAASGGYWIAAGADEIIAAPTTITGSIGVFGLFLTFEDSLEHIGVNMDGLSTTEMPYFNTAKQLEPAAEQLIQNSIEQVYQQFLTLVADARNMTTAEVHEVAQGRVWTGQAALDLGLVDALGEIDLAIARVAELAELEADSFKVSWPETHLSPAEAFVAEMFGTAMTWLPEREAAVQPSGLAEKALLQVWQDVKILNQFNDQEGVYMRCLQCKVD